MYGKLFIILDNAGAHKSKDMKEYIKSTKGDVVLWYLLPRNPQNNPIETQWRDLKRPMQCQIFKGGFEEMKIAIQKLLDRGEVVRVKLLDYMLEAIAS